MRSADAFPYLEAPSAAANVSPVTIVDEVVQNMFSGRVRLRYSDLLHRAAAGDVTHVRFANQLDVLFVWSHSSSLPQKVRRRTSPPRSRARRAPSRSPVWNSFKTPSNR